MKTPDNFLASSPIPVYAVALPRSDVLIYTGGGGRSRSGVSNAIRATSINYPSHELVDRTEVKLSNEEDAPMCLAVSKGEDDEEPTLLHGEGADDVVEEMSVGPSERRIVVGINSALTQSGDNENLRLLQWSSSGYKPTSQTSAVEKLTDAIKEKVKDNAPGENTRDKDVQEIRQVSKIQSIQVTDLEQYVRVTILSPDGKYLAVGGTDGQIALHSFPSLKRLWTAIPVASAEVVGATFSSDSALVAFVLASSIQIYSTKTDSSSSASPQVYQTIRKPALKGTSGCVFRGATFGRSGGAGKAGRSDRFYTVVNTNPASGLGSSKKDREKAKIRRCFLSVWDADKWTLLKTRKISDRPATVFALSENGKHLALSTSDLSIHVLSSQSLATIWRLKDAHAFPGTCLAFSPRGDLLVSGSADMSLRVIKVGSEEEPTTVHDLIHSTTAMVLLAIFLAFLAFYLQQRIAPDLPMEVGHE